ncbi:AAA family ATPase [Pseudomonas guariconensis]|uniref:AAA family ATPase n=1 Tax=Pseudomonas guariconensis TaxID=1288410 RepID=UPI00384E2DC2
MNSIEFYNCPIVKRSIKFELDSSKKFFVLTGYNGAGKSRIISIISEAFSATRLGKLSNRLSRWVFQAELSNGAKVRALKMEVGGASRDDIEKLADDYKAVNVDLGEMYRAATDMVSSRSKARYTGEAEPNGIPMFCINGGFVPTSLSREEHETDSDLVQVNLVSFVDEALYFNFSLNGAELALEGKTLESNIDRTLWVLIHAYVARRFDKVQMNELFGQLGSLGKVEELDINNEQVKSLLANAIQNLRDSSDLESGPVFAELNKFYGMTNRKLVWRDDTFKMVLPDDSVVSFIDFSRGEKAVLALILAAWLYGETAIFLLDEPDLSLHVEWQRMLLPALERIAPNSQFVIGTHSPFLVMNTQSETVVNLAKKYKEGN